VAGLTTIGIYTFPAALTVGLKRCLPSANTPVGVMQQSPGLVGAAGQPWSALRHFKQSCKLPRAGLSTKGEGCTL
jgi:hypothetical protein